MTKVALVAHWDWVLYNYRLPLVRALRELGAEVVLVCPPGDYTEQLESEADRWIPWSIDRPSVNPFTELGSIGTLRNIYRDVDPDLVQHYGLKPNLYGTIAAKRAGVLRIVNAFTGLGYLFSDDPRARRLRWVVVSMFRFARGWAHPWSIVLTAADLEILTAAGVVERSRTTVLPEGIDTTHFSPRDGKGKVPAPVVFMAGRLLWDKGLAELVAAARSLHARGIEARFVIAGEPDEGNPASVPRTQVEVWKKGSNIEFLGHRSDVPDLLREADIAVLPSYHEGLPRFILEAAATGLAVVASDIPGCRAILEAETSALLVPPKDARSLADALARVVQDPELRARLGSAARTAVAERFDESVIVERQLDVFRSLGLGISG